MLCYFLDYYVPVFIVNPVSCATLVILQEDSFKGQSDFVV